MPEKKTAIVTGASRGIGACLLGAFLKEAYIVVAAPALTLPLQGQKSAIGDSTEASGSVSQPASAASKQAQQVDQDPTVVKKWIEQRAEKSPMDPSTVTFDGGPLADPSASAGNPNPQQTGSAPNGQTPTTTSDHTLTGNFFHRLAQFYSQDWDGTNPAGPSVTKRGLPAPEDSPPLPFSDWTYGGAPDIGTPDGNTYPLMSALKLDSSRTKVYGWFATSINFSTSATNSFPVSYDIFPNKIELNQAVVCIERLPDARLGIPRDWILRYRLSLHGREGLLQRATLAVQQTVRLRSCSGVFRPLLPGQRWPQHSNWPVPLGSWNRSAIGAEQLQHDALAALSIDPFTDTGIYASLKLNKQWMVQFGVSGGHDVALWTDDAKASGIFCLNYSTASNRDNFYGCANGINDGKYAYNNLQDYDFTWYHKFNSKMAQGAALLRLKLEHDLSIG